MFLKQDALPSESLRPKNSEISASDWEVLSKYWYPIAEISEVGERPLPVKLLDVDLVVFTGANGPSVARDRCPHRHVRLSAGEVEDGEIVCPYHALKFNGSGRCTYAPAVGPNAKLPEMYRLQMFPVALRHGLIWTRLVESENELPTFPGFQDEPPVVFIKTRTWPVSSARQVENFFDLGHLPVIHSKTLGGDCTKPIQPGRVEHSDDAVSLIANYVENPFGGEPRVCQYTYRVVLPFAVDFNVQDETGHDMKLLDIASPRSAHECRVFQMMLDTSDVDEHHRALIEGLDAVNLEDIGILEQLMEVDLPLNQKHEIHLPVDNISHAYRERLRELGLGR